MHTCVASRVRVYVRSDMQALMEMIHAATDLIHLLVLHVSGHG